MRSSDALTIFERCLFLCHRLGLWLAEHRPAAVDSHCSGSACGIRDMAVACGAARNRTAAAMSAWGAQLERRGFTPDEIGEMRDDVGRAVLHVKDARDLLMDMDAIQAAEPDELTAIWTNARSIYGAAQEEIEYRSLLVHDERARLPRLPELLDTLPYDAANNSRDFGRGVAHAVAVIREWAEAQR